jgi:hypothetical protein
MLAHSRRFHGTVALATLGLCISGAHAAEDDLLLDDDGSNRLRLPETVVEGNRPFTAASSLAVRQRDIETRRILRPADLLEVAPGLVVVQHAGGGKANQYLLRGFDGDHGTDVAVEFDGIPVNNVSHAHGQGYTDLNWVIPEVVGLVQVDKGPYFLEHGNFATAGAVNLRTRPTFERSSATFEAGRFGIYRGLVLAGGEIGPLDGTLAVEGYGQDGPFDHPEGYTRYNLFTRLGHDAGDWDTDLTFTSYRGTWDASGQLPLRAVRDGRIDRFGSFDPTEGGTSQRHQLYGRFHWRPDPASELQVLTYGVYYDLDLFSNFTFFLKDPVNGDQIEQKDKRWYGGLEATYARALVVAGLDTELSAGLGIRGDRIGTQLANTRERSFLSKVASDGIGQINPYGYLATDVAWTPWLRTVIGFRVDGIWADVSDRFPTRDPLLAGDGAKGDALVTPKVNAVLSPFVDEASPLHRTSVFLNYGEGYHSNDARGFVRVVDAVDPMVRARGGEVGVRTNLFDRVDAALAFWLLDLDSELVFVGDEGVTEASGRTRRRGLEFELRWQLLSWLYLDTDVTWTHARFRDEPDGEDFVPLAPTWTASGGLTARWEEWFGSIRTRAISARPANEDDSLTAVGYTIWDLNLGKRWPLRGRWLGGRAITLVTEIDILNLFDRDYREAQFATTSRLPGEPAAGIDDVSFTPGYPLTVIGGVTVEF